MVDIIESTKGIECQMCGVVNWPTAMSCMNCTATLDKRPARKVFSYKVFSFTGQRPMSFSQKVARFFELTDYVLLVPATFGLALAMTTIIFSPWFALSILSSFIAGCFLLRGFFRHSRGRLSDSKTSVLWGTTIAYNMLDLIITLFIAASDRNAQSFYLMSLWPMLVIALSASALLSENQRMKMAASS